MLCFHRLLNHCLLLNFVFNFKICDFCLNPDQINDEGPCLCERKYYKSLGLQKR